MQLPDFSKFQNFDLLTHIILLGLAGSRSYGTSTPASDFDYKGLAVPPKKYSDSPFHNFEQFNFKGDNSEGTVFATKKFFGLAADCNPNVIELLFLREEDYLIVSSRGRTLLEARELFLSQKAARTFTGYALSQLRRIQTHKHWVSNPPQKEPTRDDFGLPSNLEMDAGTFGAISSYVESNLHTLAPWLKQKPNEDQEAFFESVANIVALKLEKELPETDWRFNWHKERAQTLTQIENKLNFDTNFIELIRAEKRYQQAALNWKQYQQWLIDRNAARAKLESLYGFDSKHAMHLVRLLRMGKEILQDKTVNVYRPDAIELLQIRNGEWSYEKIVEFATKEADEIYAIATKSSLPVHPNYEQLQDLYEEITKE